MSAENGGRDTGDMDEVLLQVVLTLAAELHPRQPAIRRATVDSALDRDLGFDSLSRVELLMRIEKAFGVSLPEQVFATAETPRDLLRAVQGAARAIERLAPLPVASRLGEAEAAPEHAQTLVEVLDWHVLAHPDRPHIRLYSDQEEGETITYRQLREGAEGVAAGLQQAGLLPGEAVTIMLPTGSDYFLSFFGILLAGGIPVPIYPPARPSQIEEHLRRESGVLRNCKAAMLITVPEAKPLARLLKSQVESLRRVVTVAEMGAAGGGYEAPALGPDDIAFLQYTSGSTGDPKGVVLTHANLLANIRVDGQGIQVGPSDVFVSWLPLYHDMGLIGAWLGSLYHAVLLVIMSPLAFLSRPQRWLWAIHRYRGTLSAAPNFAYELCLARIDDRDLEGLDLSAWRIAFNGAEAVSPDTVRRFSERFGRFGFAPQSMYPVYGLAECSVGLAFPPLGRGPLIDRIQRGPFMDSRRAIPTDEENASALRFVACGQPLSGHEIRIVDGAGRELPERQEGRLQFRGPSATSGYYRNPDATRALFQGEWLESGDLAYMADGDIYVTGRTKDVIIRGGRNIYPQELEEAVGETPGIRRGRVVAFGSPAPDMATERLVVLAETREQGAEALEALRAQVNGVVTDLAGMPPDEVVLAPPGTVLKTSSGKLRRAASRELYERGQVGGRRKAVWWQVVRLALSGVVPALRRGMRSGGVALYGAYAWTLFRILGSAVWLGLMLLPRADWRWAMMRAAARLLARATATPLVVSGLDRLPTERACILVCNHASYLDGFALVAALPMEFSFVAKAELAESALLRPVVRRIRTELVDRFDKERGVADSGRLARVARAGRSLLFFPEGTFTRMSGLLPFRMGAFVTAVDAGLPVVPIAIRGTRSMLRSGSSLPRRGAIVVTIGAPVEVMETGGEPWSAALRLRDEVRAYILRHCGEPDLALEPASPPGG